MHRAVPNIKTVGLQQNRCISRRGFGSRAVEQRAGRQQLAGIGVLRVVEHLQDRRLLDGLSVTQHGHLVGHLADDPEIVA